jgi:hypothetical protein
MPTTISSSVIAPVGAPTSNIDHAPAPDNSRFCVAPSRSQSHSSVLGLSEWKEFLDQRRYQPTGNQTKRRCGSVLTFGAAIHGRVEFIWLVYSPPVSRILAYMRDTFLVVFSARPLFLMPRLLQKLQPPHLGEVVGDLHRIARLITRKS